MQGPQRREQIMTLLSESGAPVTGRQLAYHFGVSRQVIVQDVALLRASGKNILSTTTGYLVLSQKSM